MAVEQGLGTSVAGVEATVRDYFGGWFEGSPARMEAAQLARVGERWKILHALWAPVDGDAA